MYMMFVFYIPIYTYTYIYNHMYMHRYIGIVLPKKRFTKG